MARGARATEDAVIRAVLEQADAVLDDASALARPVRIIVPSKSLRAHLAARLVACQGKALAGVVLHTLHGLAHELLRRAPKPHGMGRALFPLLVRRRAEREPVLAGALERLLDGYGVVEATVADLLDAGFDGTTLEPALECLEGGGAARERARALLRVALDAGASLAEEGLEHPATLFTRALDALVADPELALPARGIHVHGFADATGTQLQLLEGLLRHPATRVWMDRPDDAAGSGRPDPGVAFVAPLLERLGGLAGIESVSDTPPGACPALLEAPGMQAEVAAVAQRVASLLAAGECPERIALVARNLSPYATAICRQLQGRGIPFSGGSDSHGTLGPGNRRLAALLELLHRRGRMPIARFLELCDGWDRTASDADGVARADLRVAFHALGLGRVEEVGRFHFESLEGDSGFLRLPLREGFRGTHDVEGSTVPAWSAVFRRVSRRTLQAAGTRAKAALERLARLEQASALEEQLGIVETLVRTDLCWETGPPWTSALDDTLHALRTQIDGRFACSRDEFLRLLDPILAGAGRLPLGGAGAGVQVLSVTEARARTFEHLFLLGMNRDLFPRTVLEDPLLGDRIRWELRAVIPELPVKRRGHEEERYLFAQLLSSSPEVTLSWQTVSDDGKEKSLSPLVARIQMGGGTGEVERAASIHAEPGAGAAGPGPPASARERAVLAGLHGGYDELTVAIELGLRENGFEESTARRVADARVAIVREIGRRPTPELGLGPYLGMIGPIREPSDPRRGVLAVTTLERIAVCPWRAFLDRSLRIEPLPDPLAELPSVSPLHRGTLLHRVLEKIVIDAGGAVDADLIDASSGVPVDVPWPDAVKLEQWLLEEARAVLSSAGIGWPGFETLLVEGTRDALARIRASDWPGGLARGVLGVEIDGWVDLPETTLPEGGIRFRADRVDAVDDRVQLTDYKSGNPLSTAKRAKKREEHLQKAIQSGSRLQAAAYAAASGPDAASGRYLFAGPKSLPETVEAEVRSSDSDLLGSFGGAVEKLAVLYTTGGFFPRLLDARGRDEPRTCSSCEMRIACSRGDTESRQRLRAGLQSEAPPMHETQGERAARDAWKLGGTP